VLIHLKPPPFLLARSRQSSASNFLAARIGAFEASLCYAKITPVALQRGGCDRPGGADVEALGRKPKFELSEFLSAITGSPAQAPQGAPMAAV
jgi:hypothetical protein